MKKRLFLLALSALPIFTFAQDKKFFGMDQNGGGFYVAPSIYFSNIKTQYDTLHLNEVQSLEHHRLNAIAYPTPTQVIGVAIGGFGVRNNFLFGGEFNGFWGPGKSQSLDSTGTAGGTKGGNFDLKNTTLGGDVLAMFGVVALRSKGLVITPQVGAGYGAMGQLISDSRKIDRQYPFYTTGDQEHKWIYNTGFTFDVGLGVDYYLGGSTESKAKGFRLGVKVGFRDQLGGSWNATGGGLTSNYNGLALPSPSKLGSNGLYLKLTLGVGSIGNK